MPLSEKLLQPFRKWFRAPTLDTPFSTIEMPSLGFTTTIVFVSFFIIVGGFVFCFVRNMPMAGYTRGPNGQPQLTWIETNGISSQFLAEGIVASMVFSLGAGSLISAYYLMNKKSEKSKQKKQEEPLDGFLGIYAVSAPVWVLLAFVLFQAKIPSYFPRFSA